MVLRCEANEKICDTVTWYKDMKNISSNAIFDIQDANLCSGRNMSTNTSQKSGSTTFTLSNLTFSPQVTSNFTGEFNCAVGAKTSSLLNVTLTSESLTVFIQ